MPGLTIRRPVAVHVIVTEQFKQELAAELQEAVDATRKRIDQLEFEARRFLADLQRTDLTQAMEARRRIEVERRRHEALRDELVKQADEAAKLELGSEFPRGTLEGLVEVCEGDNLADKLAGATLVIKEGIVQEIREGLSADLPEPSLASAPDPDEPPPAEQEG
jgi:hypothetical protein